MSELLADLRDSIQEALDNLLSSRSSFELKSEALHTLERHLSHAYVPKDLFEDLHNFTALQYTFECNVPSRLLAWISLSTSSLEILTNKGTMDSEHEVQASRLASQLSLSLSLIQGVTLNHNASKLYLGRKYALEVLLDLLLASRHLSSVSLPAGTSNSSSARSTTIAPPPLSSMVLDTLLCIFVDSPAALRAFEDAGGIQVVVKILKRAGTPREVRMKCLEFLYFYLLDETSSTPDGLVLPPTTVPTPPPTAPATPHRSSKPFISSKPLRPSRYGISDSPFASTASTPSSRSTSGSSAHSVSSISSNTSISTVASSVSSSPEKPPSVRQPKTPPNSPPLAPKRPQQLQPRSLMMLRKEVDYVPLSPKKPHVSRGNASSTSRHVPGRSISKLRLGSGSEDDCRVLSHLPSIATSGRDQEGKAESERPIGQKDKIRTTEEKKELLGTMLGNVDALVEGVRKAGIWGLG